MATNSPTRKRGAVQPESTEAPARKGRRSAAQDLTLLLRERIANGDLPPGSKLNEYDLAAEFSIPRTRVRDAFIELEQRGLIERTPNRGAMVAKLGPDQVFRIYDIREVLEGLCVRLATQNTQPEAWKPVYDAFRGPVTDASRREDFSSIPNGSANSGRVDRGRRQSRTPHAGQYPEKTQVLIRRIVILPGRAETGVRQQCDILRAMCEGNAELAEEMRRNNIRDAKACLQQYLNYLQ